MEEINTIYADMPTTLHAYVIANADDTYTIILNAKLSREQHLLSYYHERRHIENGDYETTNDVGLIELFAHLI